MSYPARGFTLIEMSIVLVIIGLVVGGVLVGQDLIRAATMRAQISQIEKFQVAVNAFRGKYGYLPGDIKDPEATNFGLAPRIPGYAGQGDGNGILEGVFSLSTANTNCGWCVADGENAVFWDDLTYANGLKLNMIEGNFRPSGAMGQMGDSAPGSITAANMYLWIPVAKIGNGNVVHTWSENGINYFGLSVGVVFGYYNYTSTVGLTVRQSYDIDAKIDDGLPQTGRVIARYVNTPGVVWAGATGTSATAGSPSACYDNSATSNGTPGVAGAIQHYSVEISGGAGVNCAMSFQFQ